MNATEHDKHPDPLGLRELDLLEPDRDGWDEIRSALEADAAPPRRSRHLPWLAAVASFAFVALLVTWLPKPGNSPVTVQPELAQTTDPSPTLERAEQPGAARADLIAMSQALETRLRKLRDHTGAMPADSAAYAAELEDLIARVDGELSFDPESLDLWGQRVNLLLDLEFIYQHQFEREYGRMASL